MSSTGFYQKCLQNEFERRVRKNSGYSIRAFARALELSPAALSQILSGKRTPSLKAAQKIVESLKLASSDSEKFLQSLAQTQRSRGLKRLNPVFRKMPLGLVPSREVDVRDFEAIADWYHYAILELTFIEGFQSDLPWIAKELGISQVVARGAVERLLRAGLLSRDSAGNLKKSVETITTAQHGKTAPALRMHQRQILERAVESLENDPIESRCMHSMTIAIDPKNIPIAREMIRQFTRSVCQALETGNRKEVYQLGVALYPVKRN